MFDKYIINWIECSITQTVLTKSKFYQSKCLIQKFYLYEPIENIINVVFIKLRFGKTNF